MSAKRISILIFSVIAGLVVLCSIFPHDGIDLGGMQLRFPGLIEAMIGDTTQQIDPEEQMALLEQEQLALQHAQEDSDFVSRINQSKSRIWFPHDDVTYFDPVFEALDDAREHPARIIHYGDSQIELDRMTSTLREMLQGHFGGRGRGWFPIVSITGSYTLSTNCSPQLHQGLQYSFVPETRPRDHKTGPYATAAYLDGGSVTVTARAVNKPEYGNIAGFTRVKVVTGDNSALTISIGDKRTTVAATPGLTVTTIDIDSARDVRVNIAGRAHLYGIMLDSKTGVQVDNVPMRGCTGTIFASINREQMSSFFKQENVPLIIMQFGGNAVPGISPKNCEAVAQELRKQIEYFKTVAPTSRILFIGPSDMATSRGGGVHTYKNLALYIDTLKAMCLDAGVAFWDMYAVMGGEDSMVSWKKNGWAGGDYIHFTPKGAERMATLLGNSIMLYYDYYTFRQNAPENQ